jgi:hypothetical protein
VTAPAPGRAYGHCCDCGEAARGRIVGIIDQGSGPGYVVIVCAECDPQPGGGPEAAGPPNAVT